MYISPRPSKKYNTINVKMLDQGKKGFLGMTNSHQP